VITVFMPSLEDVDTGMWKTCFLHYSHKVKENGTDGGLDYALLVRPWLSGAENNPDQN
jgi:hypothetical protein